MATEKNYQFAKVLSMTDVSAINRALGLIEGLSWAVQESGIADGLISAVERIEAVIDKGDTVERESVKDAIGFMNLHFLGHGETKSVLDSINEVPTVDAYTAHEVAEIIAELFGDTCACNFNGIDEWLPFKCELLDCCPNTYGVACWEQYLKFRDGERKENR